MFRGNGKRFLMDELLKLIRMYRENECLWNIRSKKYKRFSLRAAAFQKIASEFGISVDAVKRKLKSLRSTYVIEKRKMEDSKMANTETHEPKLFWFREMKFLDRIIVYRNQPSRCAQTEDTEEGEASFLSDKIEVLESINESPALSVQRLCSYVEDSGNPLQDDGVSIELYHETENTHSKITLESPDPSIKRRRLTSSEKDDNPLQIDDTLHKEAFFLPQAATEKLLPLYEPQPTTEDNVFDLFGRTVALHLNELFKLDKKSAYEVMQQQHLIMSQKMIEVLQQRHEMNISL